MAGLALALGLSGGARGQEWITPESCAVAPAGLTTATLPEAYAAEVEARAGTIPNGTGRLWRITAPDGAVSHLWGTFHSSDPLILGLPEALRAALNAARVLVLETDQRAKSRTEIEERFLQAGVWLAPEHMPHDKPYLSGPERDWVMTRIAGLFQGPEAFPALTDAGLAFYLLSDPCEDFTAGVVPVQDQRLLLGAIEAGVPVAALENWDALLQELSQPERQETAQAIARLQGAYLNPDGFSAARRAAFRLYREGRIAALMEWNRLYLSGFFGGDAAAGLMAQADGYMIGERDVLFVRRMRKHLDAGGALVAVGAFHLPGEQGLIALLRAEGYAVERVPVPGEAD